MVHEPGPHGVLPVAEFPAGSRVSPLCRSVRRGWATARLLLLGSVSVDGLCPTHLPGWPSRHRSVPAVSGRQTLPYGFSRSGGRIVQCEMILKSISFPMQDDPEIGILPRCEVDADSDEEYGSADAGSD